MVSEVTDILFAGIISGWLVAITQPIISWILKKLDASGIIKILFSSLVYILWLLAMMIFVLKLYK